MGGVPEESDENLGLLRPLTRAWPAVCRLRSSERSTLQCRKLIRPEVPEQKKWGRSPHPLCGRVC